ncbi:MAG: RNA polymerase sigma factor [Prolixibacteraceae bacterium]|nr:RNA polymerase sigma factor [Prolixibacteraceae bacterium]MBN2773914.1 RNA polymerase sigma factor [Prolixibacteraceae bacterium]
MNKLNYNNLPDEEILQVILKENNKDLYDIIYKRYFNKVTDRCFSFLKNKLLATEFANDILIKAYENLHGFKGNSSFSSWLYSITYNHIIDFLRKKKQLHYPNWNRENEIPEIIDESTTDVEEISYDNLMKIFEIIHPEEKALLLMKYQHGLSLREIAKSLSISDDAVKMRLKRARSRVIYLYHKEYD